MPDHFRKRKAWDSNPERSLSRSRFRSGVLIQPGTFRECWMEESNHVVRDSEFTARFRSQADIQRESYGSTRRRQLVVG